MRWKLSWISLLILIVYLGCTNPFATREPEPPETGGKRLRMLNPLSSLNVLNNLKISYQGLSPLDYMDTLSEDFLFLPDEGDRIRFENVYSEDRPWNKTQEEIFANKLLNENVTESIRFRSWPPDLVESTDGGRIERYEYKYDISISFHNQDAPQSIRGTAWLTLREEEGGIWFIYRWEDAKTDTAAGTWTWGELRARF